MRMRSILLIVRWTTCGARASRGAFIALHGRYGEDGTVQGALELLRIPYTGSGVLASAIAMDKVRTKEIWAARGLSTPPSMVLRRGDVLREVPDHLGLPLIMKPPHEGSTLGVSKVMGYSDVNEGLICGPLRRGGAGRGVRSKALNSPSRSGQGSRCVCSRSLKSGRRAGTTTSNKYNTHDTQYLCPAPLAPDVTDAVQALALAAYLGDRLRGLGPGRSDAARARQPALPAQVNTSPGMTDHSAGADGWPVPPA